MLRSIGGEISKWGKGAFTRHDAAKNPDHIAEQAGVGAGTLYRLFLRGMR